MIDLIHLAVTKGAKLFSNISGGKDGQAMTKMLIDWKFPIEGLVHADLGKAEWPQSLQHCELLSVWHNLPLHVVRRRDGADLVDHWKNRMIKLQGTNKPHWSSSANRYCTSDLKRDPINVFYTSTGFDFIISCEGIRKDESVARSKKEPLTIRRSSSTYYDGMSVEEAINNFVPGKKLILNWYPIFNFSIDEVWATYDNSQEQLEYFRKQYKQTDTFNDVLTDKKWNFHPAYVYGNERVSCAICVLASENDIRNGIKHNPQLYDDLVTMELESGFSFKNKFALHSVKL